MRKTTMMTLRLDTQTAKTLKSVRRGEKEKLLKELIETNTKTVRRYTTKRAA